jgi:hypothetical protein
LDPYLHIYINDLIKHMNNLLCQCSILILSLAVGCQQYIHVWDTKHQEKWDTKN